MMQRKSVVTKWGRLGLRYMSIERMLLKSRNLRKTTPEVYKKLRGIVAMYERSHALGSDIQLTSQERKANEIIMCEKMAEYNRGILQPSEFTPGYHIFEMLDKIKQSPLFNMLKMMPKGGALKMQDKSMCRNDYLLELTYREHLWICTNEHGCNAIAFRFSKEKPTKKTNEDCEWMLMEDYRKCRGEHNVLEYLQSRFSMYPMSSFSSTNEAWTHLMSIFALLEGLLNYAPVRGEYYYNALKEFDADGVQYLEVRSTLPSLYGLDGETYPPNKTVQIYKEQLEKYKSEHPEFVDSKLIFAPLRNVEPETIGEYVKTCAELNKEFPDFVVGFDLIGQEDLGRPLKDFVEELLKLPKNINFYFQAGQTNWHGTKIDENLIDAVLLGTKRIGHGYAIIKHPLIMNLVRFLNIAIEVCPVTNQVLRLGQDFRNHPAATLLSQNVPIVISSGNPSFYRSAPLSHDFYMAFLGIAPMNADLKFLKRVAKNSIKYGALRDEEKGKAYIKWKIKWDKWINEIVENKDQKNK